MDMEVKTTYRRISDLGNPKFLEERGISDADHILDIWPSKERVFSSNPFLKDRNDVVQIIGSVDGIAMGRLNRFPYQIVADGEVLDVISGESLLVKAEYRKTLYALDICQLQLDLTPSAIEVSCGLSAQAQKLTRLGKMASMFSIPKFAFVRHCSTLVRDRLPTVVRFVLCPLLDVLFLLHRLIIGSLVRLRTMGWRFEAVDLADEAKIQEFCSLVASDAKRFRINVTPAWVRWVNENDFKGAENPIKRLYRCTKGNELVGYVMTRAERHEVGGRAKIQEWQLTERYANREGWFLIRAAMLIAKLSDFVVISLSAAETRTIRLLKRLLLKLPGQVVVVTACKGSPLRVLDGYKDISKWRLRPAMGDACFY